MSKYPKSLRMGDASSAFERVPDLYALHSPTRADSARASTLDAPVAVVSDGAMDEYTVYRDQPGRKAADADAWPVYSTGPGGPLAVPTGRVLVRLKKKIDPGQRREEFAAAGFEIESMPSYAPSSAWLKAQAGGVAGALNGLDALSKIESVEHVEPQLLMARVFKHA